jgi:hypothetical protein
VFSSRSPHLAAMSNEKMRLTASTLLGRSLSYHRLSSANAVILGGYKGAIHWLSPERSSRNTEASWPRRKLGTPSGVALELYLQDHGTLMYILLGSSQMVDPGSIAKDHRYGLIEPVWSGMLCKPSRHSGFTSSSSCTSMYFVFLGRKRRPSRITG